MKTDLVVVDGKLGLVTGYTPQGIRVKVFATNYECTYDDKNVRFVDVPMGEKTPSSLCATCTQDYTPMTRWGDKDKRLHQAPEQIPTYLCPECRDQMILAQANAKLETEDGK